MYKIFRGTGKICFFKIYGGKTPEIQFLFEFFSGDLPPEILKKHIFPVPKDLKNFEFYNKTKTSTKTEKILKKFLILKKSKIFIKILKKLRFFKNLKKSHFEDFVTNF